MASNSVVNAIFLEKNESTTSTLTHRQQLSIEAFREDPIILTVGPADFLSLEANVQKIIFNHYGMKFINVTIGPKTVAKITVCMEDISKARLSRSNGSNLMTINVPEAMAANILRSEFGIQNIGASQDRLISFKYTSVRSDSIVKLIFMESHFKEMSSRDAVNFNQRHEVNLDSSTSQAADMIPHASAESAPKDALLMDAVRSVFFGNVETQIGADVVMSSNGFHFNKCRIIDGKHLDDPIKRFDISVLFSDASSIDIATGARSETESTSSYMFILLKKEVADTISQRFQLHKVTGALVLNPSLNRQEVRFVSFAFKSKDINIIKRLLEIKSVSAKPLDEATTLFKDIRDYAKRSREKLRSEPLHSQVQFTAPKTNQSHRIKAANLLARQQKREEMRALRPKKKHKSKKKKKKNKRH